MKYRVVFLVIALLFVSFPDIFLSPGSLAVTDYARWDGEGTPLSFYPSSIRHYKGMLDPGGAIWQSEPKIGFMKNVFATKESPYWNPYAASGTLGPETLTDIKFSPLTIMSALLGGSSLAISFVTLLFLGLGSYALMKTCTQILKLPMIAGIAAACAYMFNGFHVTGLSCNHIQPYLLFPIYLYALFAFVKYGGVLRFIGAYLGAALVMMVTFIPTMTFAIISITLLGMGYAWTQPHQRRLKMLAAVAAVPLCAALMVAFIYLPALDALSINNDTDVYSKRVFYPATINGLLSMFTPVHLWSAYRQDMQIFGEPVYPVFAGNSVFHIGVTGGLLVLLSLKGNMPKGLFVATWMIVIASLLRIFGVPVFEYDFWRFPAYRNTAILHTAVFFVLAFWWAFKVSGRTRWLPLLALCILIGIFGIDFYDRAINALPLLGNFGEQYTWIVPMLCLPLLVAYGMAAVERRVPVFPRARIYLGLLAAFFVYLAFMYPLKDYRWPIATTAAIFIAILSVNYWVCKRERLPSRRWPTALMLLMLLYVEYWSYTSHLHPTRNDPFTNPPEYITYIRERIGNHRIANLGLEGMGGEVAGAYQIPDVSSMTMNVPHDYMDFFHKDFLPEEYPTDFAGLIGVKDTGNLDLNLVNLLGVRYVIAPKNWSIWEATLKQAGYSIAFETIGKKRPGFNIYENPTPWPRAFVIARPAEKLTVDAIKNKTISLKNLTPATLAHYGHTRVSIDVDAAQAGTLVLTDNWYPYWYATLNGEKVQVEKVFRTFRGVLVPKGKSHVEFFYDNPAVNLGIRISAVFALFTLALGSLAAYRNVSTASQNKVSGLLP